ncbi:MAG: ribonuclease E/G, partial [Brevundimonas sp.]|uniref:Rne/Rng family ribonuclease n=1 Tax=Brevundimonas sp. TaxID=1871086 RepID=UPI001219ECF3
QILLVQVVKDERGAKGAALTTWLSLAGRYCVLMPNTGKGGGISRKITSLTDRKRLKAAAASLSVPAGMGLIIRTAGAKRTKAEIQRDYDYLLRLWETIRETTLKSNAPAVIYEEENLVRRAVRDMYDKDFDGIQVEGVEGFKEARDFMRVLMPSQSKKIHLYQGSKPLFAANGIEELLTQIHQPVVPLKSGGYLVINQTEALVAIDVNSGRATKERNVEATATKTNMEAAVEAARQLRLRDLAGLIVIDFIDMDEGKNNRAVEKALKDALAKDRARIQMGRISGFGLMEISRQRRRLGVIEGATEACAHCQGTGRIRSAESAALMTLRAVDIEAGKNGAGAVILRVCTAVGLYILNHKRDYLQRLQQRRGLSVIVQIDDSLGQGEHNIDRTETNEDFVPQETPAHLIDLDDGFDDSAFVDEYEDEVIEEDEDEVALDREDSDDDEPRERAERGEGGRGRGRRRRRGGRRDDEGAEASEGETVEAGELATDDDDSEAGRRRRRGRRGGRRMREDGERDAFTWVRGRTPSLDDPYVWFDPINPTESAPVRAERPAPAQDRADEQGERPEGERLDGEREGGRRRRRRRGGRGGERGLPHEVKVEARATTEGMPPEGDSDTPIAVEAPTVEDAAPALIEQPKRRRVRRKVAADVGGEAVLAEDAVVEPAQADAVEEVQPDITVVEPNETVPVGEPVELDVTPAEAAAEGQPAVLVEARPAPTPEADLSEIIANDPNQITAPPSKPKRGWWRR